MKITIDTDKIDNLIQQKVNDYLESESGQKVVDKSIDNWIKKFMNIKDFEIKVHDRLSKIITQESLSKILNVYNVKMFSNKINEILAQVIQYDNKFKQAIRTEIKNIIRF